MTAKELLVRIGLRRLKLNGSKVCGARPHNRYDLNSLGFRLI